MYDLKSLYVSIHGSENSTRSGEKQVYRKIKEPAPFKLKRIQFIKRNSSFEDHHQQHEDRKDEDEIRDT